jgi:ketosteroid isomerase-like protein
MLALSSGGSSCSRYTQEIYSMRLSHYLVLVVFGLAVVSCSPQNFDSAAEGQKLLRRDAEWADLANAGKDVEKIVSYWSDDAVLIFPGQPVLEGKAAIRAYVAASLNTPGFKIHWVSQKPVFSSDGKFAYMRGTDELTVPERCIFAEYQSGAWTPTSSGVA